MSFDFFKSIAGNFPFSRILSPIVVSRRAFASTEDVTDSTEEKTMRVCEYWYQNTWGSYIQDDELFLLTVFPRLGKAMYTQPDGTRQFFTELEEDSPLLNCPCHLAHGPANDIHTYNLIRVYDLDKDEIQALQDNFKLQERVDQECHELRRDRESRFGDIMAKQSVVNNFWKDFTHKQR